MATKRKKDDEPTDPKGRARDRGAVRLVTFEIDPALDDAFEAQRQKDRRTRRAEFEMAIEEFLRVRGALPGAPADEGAGEA